MYHFINKAHKINLLPNKLSTALALSIGVVQTVNAQFPSNFELSTLNTSGIALIGEEEFDFMGNAVDGIGDVNGDGIDDVLIGANKADVEGNSNTGKAYVVFGRATGLPSSLNMSDLDSTNGFIIQGDRIGGGLGSSVTTAGDINGDGINDILMSAIDADQGAGRSYVIFGRNTSDFPSPFNLVTLNGTNGFAINGENDEDYSGISVKNAGDFNGDGIDDIIIGAFQAETNGNTRSGKSYVVFGKNTGFSHPFELSSLDGTNGVNIHGENEYDTAGHSVSAAGDVNGDGIDDILVGAPRADPNTIDLAGNAYVIFGKSTGHPNPIELSNIDGTNGFTIHGEGFYNLAGGAVSSAGDVNNDGIDDILVGAFRASSNGNSFSGKSYVVFGNDLTLPHPFNLSSINSSNGFVMNGEIADELSGLSLSGIGDINFDGIDDIAIGGFRGGTINSIQAGVTYVVYGSNQQVSSPLNLSSLNGNNGFKIHGADAEDNSGRAVRTAGDFNGDGVDDLIIGAYRASESLSLQGKSYVVFGKEKPIFQNGFE